MAGEGVMQVAGGGEPVGQAYHRISRRRRFLIALLVLATAFSVLVNIATGPAGLSLSVAINGLLWPDSLTAGESVILWSVRLPSAVMALAVGACLGLAGAETQTVLNNPLASPYTLGISWAATLGAVLAIIGGPGVIGLATDIELPVFAFLFALLAGLGILLLGQMFGTGSETIILFGIALVFLCTALVALLQFVGNADEVQQTVLWSMGSLARATLQQAMIILAVLVVTAPFAFRAAWSLTLLRGGEDQAESLGLSLQRMRVISLFRASLLTAAATAFAGPIGFIGLVGPHIARLLLGEDHRYFLPGAALVGALLLSLASIAAKTAFPGILVPVGLVTALLGLPAFVALVILQRRGG